MELARPWGLLHPEAAPLSVLFGYFLSQERKYRPRQGKRKSGPFGPGFL